jgi:hypothetical protein
MPEACGRAHPSSVAIAMQRIMLRNRDFLRLQNTRLARHQFFELGKIFH